jgi:TonB family protein
MKTKPDISDEQIRSYMNFEALLDQRNKMVQAMGKGSPIKLTVLIMVMLMLATVWYYVKVKDNANPDNLNNPAPENEIIRQPSLLPDEPDVEKKENEETKFETRQSENPVPQDGKNKVTPPDKENKNYQKETSSSEKEKTQDQVKTNPENTVPPEVSYVQAEPVQGYPALYEYFNRELQYPQEAIKDSIQGVVTVTFYINATGVADRIKVENSLGELFDRETIRMIENMPPWKPATINGKPVESRLSLPLTFNIKRIQE